MMKQQILILETKGYDLRSEVFGWTFEDSSNFRADHRKPIGLSTIDDNKRKEDMYFIGENIDCPLRAMAFGWRLMAPPTKDGECYIWWLEL